MNEWAVGINDDFYKSILLFSACLSLPKERLEDMFDLCRYIQSWCLRSVETERHKSQNSFLRKVKMHCFCRWK